MQWNKIDFPTLLKGAAIGIAEVIPGISGGTIALITGIYEKLIYNIKSLGIDTIRQLLKGNWKKSIQPFDITFLAFLLTGMITGIVIGVIGVSWLLMNYPEPLWGFFFGLILASCVYVGKQIPVWNPVLICGLVLGVLVAYFITILSPSEGYDSLWYLFVCAIIGVSALILPGVSGSFILLLLGMYTVIIQAVKGLLTNWDFESMKIVAVFLSGCVVGLITFSRVMSFLFQRFKYITLAVLTGFMLGSLNKIWPWRNISKVLNKNDGTFLSVSNLEEWTNLDFTQYKILTENNVLPAHYFGEPNTVLTICSLILGVVLVWIMDKVAVKQNII